MTKLVNPVLFSNRFGIDPSALEHADLVDPLLNADTRLFIDPLLLSTSRNELVRIKGFNLLKTQFEKIVRLIAASRTDGDAAWKAASKLLNLNERPETGLGYGGASTSGSSRPDEIKQLVLTTTKEIIELGEHDPEIISLMGMFEKGVGPDTISDLSTNMILPILCEITEQFCASNNVGTIPYPKMAGRELPENPFQKGGPIILVPRDVVRDLPLAADWSDVSRVVMEVEEIRDAFNSMIGGIAQATLTEKKLALKAAALKSLENFRQIFEAVLGSSNHYDPNDDILNYYNFRKMMSGDLAAFKTEVDAPQTPNASELKRIVTEIISHFQYMVENNNLWELLWIGNRPKRERAAQLIFFAVADLFCKANNIDISPETHSGGGPVDFKFSTGYSNRLLVEIKLSKGTVIHGYKKQLETYKTAARTDASIFLVINVGNMGKKLKTINILREQRLKSGEIASEIIVVDGRRKKSASIS
jgi:hypothetical protein